IVDGVAELGANLAQAQSDNRRLLRQSLEVQERERRLIARDLHDEIGQNLAAMDTEAALLQQYGLSGNPELKQRILGIRAGITALYDSLHGLLARLRPAGLDEFGLGSALQSLIADWSSRCPQICFKARIEVEHIEGNSLTQIHLYRIAQEALTNAVRHSGADTISLILSRNANGNICLQISDDGRGMLRSAPAAVVGVINDGRVRLGLIGMAERAEILGTRLIVDTVAGQGTRISTCLPNALPDRNASVVSHGAVT
ncbi:MAG: histidine kinase, partial [Nevskia sp.]|nr:histidine kinase [Nevskia sp.]